MNENTDINYEPEDENLAVSQIVKSVSKTSEKAIELQEEAKAEPSVEVGGSDSFQK